MLCLKSPPWHFLGEILAAILGECILERAINKALLCIPVDEWKEDAKRCQPQGWEHINQVLPNVPICHRLTKKPLQLEAWHLHARYIQHGTHSLYKGAFSLAWTQKKAGNQQAVHICFLNSLLQHLKLLWSQPRDHHQIRSVRFPIGNRLNNHKLMATSYEKKNVCLRSSGVNWIVLLNAPGTETFPSFFSFQERPEFFGVCSPLCLHRASLQPLLPWPFVFCCDPASHLERLLCSQQPHLIVPDRPLISCIRRWGLQVQVIWMWTYMDGSHCRVYCNHLGWCRFETYPVPGLLLERGC